jgi:hypothetical protein
MYETLLQLLRTEGFLEKVALLALGAVLTGFLVPWVKTKMDRGSARRKTLLDAGLARQNEIITAQIRLLEQFSSLSWKYLFAAFKVSYSYAAETKKAQLIASDEFAPLSWQLLMEIRATLSFAKRLASPQTQALLKATYDWMVWLDQKIWTMVAQQDTAGVWREFHGLPRLEIVLIVLSRALRRISTFPLCKTYHLMAAWHGKKRCQEPFLRRSREGSHSGLGPGGGVNFSSAWPTKRFPSPRCASAIQIMECREEDIERLHISIRLQRSPS